MGFLPVRGPALDLTRAYPKHIERYTEDVGRNLRTRIAGDSWRNATVRAVPLPMPCGINQATPCGGACGYSGGSVR